MSEPRFREEQIAAVNRDLATAPPQTTLRWAAQVSGKKLTMATAFGPEGCCLIHLLAEIDPTVRHFQPRHRLPVQETLELRERIQQRYGVEVECIRPEFDRGGVRGRARRPALRHRPDQCCYDRKILPLRKAVAGYEAWVTAIRRDQSTDRAAATSSEWTEIQPGEGQPVAGLDEEGRAGNSSWITTCRTTRCTTRAIRASAAGRARRPIGEGGDERDGRWAGSRKKECGLHVIEVQGGSGI